jgi:hypothetical protein
MPKACKCIKLKAFGFERLNIVFLNFCFLRLPDYSMFQWIRLPLSSPGISNTNKTCFDADKYPASFNLKTLFLNLPPACR